VTLDRFGIPVDNVSEYEEPQKARPAGPGLTEKQKRAIFDTIQEYAPDHVKNVVFEDVVNQMNQMEQDGYTLPRTYEKSKHNMDENEYKLFEQQLNRDRKMSKSRAANMIKFSAGVISGLCGLFNIDAIRTKKLKATVTEAIEKGEFDDSLDGMGTVLRGTVAENAMFGTMVKMAEKINEAHDAEVKEEQEHTAKLEQLHAKRDKETIRALAEMRQAQQPPIGNSAGPSHSSSSAVPVDTSNLIPPHIPRATSANAGAFSHLPPPPSLRTRAGGASGS
jgi:hypothetical protein